MIFYIILTLAVISVYKLFFGNRKRPSVPNGLKEVPLEKGLPLIGIINKIKPNLHGYLMELGKKHGPLFRIKLGMRDILIMNNYDVMRKTLKEDGDNFSGRYIMRYLKLLSRFSGVILTDGELWAEQRSFVLKVLRDFGLGKSKSVEIVQNECCHLLKEIEASEGQHVDFSTVVPTYTSNIISKFIMNKRYPKGDKKLALIDRIITTTTKSKDYSNLLFMMFPWLDESDFLCKLILTVTSTWQMLDESHETFQREIDEHVENLDLNSEGEDLIDRFLIKQHQLKQKTGSASTFTNWQLLRNAFELFIAGYETTSTTLGWAFMFMSKFPEVQDNVYKEIIDEIGKERMPTMNDKRSLNYTQAVMDEIMRMCSVVPIAMFHRNFSDTSVNGHFIPKNSFIMPNIYACHYDPDIWESPMEFNPNRFLSADVDGNLKYSPRVELILFGIGKRQCLGESLARMEYFIFFTSLIQRFKVSFSSHLSEAKYRETLQGNDAFMRMPAKTDLTFIRR